MSDRRAPFLAALLVVAVVVPSTALAVTGARRLGPTGSYGPSAQLAETAVVSGTERVATEVPAAAREPSTTNAAVPSPTTSAASTTTAAEPASTTTAVPTSTQPAASSAVPSDPVPNGSIGGERDWELMFADEFDGSELDATSWARCYWWSESGCTNASNGELQWYVPEAVQVVDGTLRLTAQRQDAVGADGERFEYTSGIVSGVGYDGPLRLFTYGYFEVRARVPSGRGLWPAFWMLPGSEESKPEIDIMEALGQNPAATLMYFHWRTADGSEPSTGQWWEEADMSLGWHTYAVHWELDRLTWYIDGVPRLELTSDQVAVPAEPMYLLLDLAVGGDFATEPDADTVFPATFEIDYVRAWRES